MWGRGYRDPRGRRIDGPARSATVRCRRAPAENRPGTEPRAITGNVPSAAKADAVPFENRRASDVGVGCDPREGVVLAVWPDRG